MELRALKKPAGPVDGVVGLPEIKQQTADFGVYAKFAKSDMRLVWQGGCSHCMTTRAKFLKFTRMAELVEVRNRDGAVVWSSNQ